MMSEYAKDFSYENPVIRVMLQKENGETEDHRVNIHEIDTRNASEIEIFALCTYADNYEKKTGKNDDYWQIFQYYRECALKDGYLETTDQGKDFEMIKKDWDSMIHSKAVDYMDSKLYKQSLDGNKLLDMFQKYSGEIREMDSVMADHSAKGGKDLQEKVVINIGILNLDYNTTLYFSDEGELICSDYGAGGDYIWSRPLTEEQMKKCDELTKNSQDFAAYMYSQDFWDDYLDGKIDLEMLKRHSREMERRENLMFEGCEKRVREAWKKAEQDTGISGLGLDENGKMRYISEYARQLLRERMKGEEGNILGDTVETAIEFAKRAIESIENSLNEKKETISLTQEREREKEFYIKFIKNLSVLS